MEIKKINELSDNITNLIAAGEVVERPMNVVKELVENSIDAASTSIKIDLTDCGLVGICVLDNGEGINQSQLELAVKRHATSKILNEDDLFKIASLGFRGEALASICSVSEFRITSNDGNTNYYIQYKAGKKINEGIANLPRGTQVEVKNLFFNTPARYKHLGNEYQELNAISDYVYKVAISNPNISIQLSNNGKLLFKSSGNNDLLEVISEAYGVKTASKMIEFKNKNNFYTISGYSTNNEIFKSNRNALVVIVNGRVIRNLNILYAITDAYQTILPVGKYPVTILNIKCDYDLIDVNVHPSKLEIRFTDEASLKYLITQTIKKALHEQELLKFQKAESRFTEVEMSNDEDFEVSSSLNEVDEKESEDDWTLQFDETKVTFIEPVIKEEKQIEQVQVNFALDEKNNQRTFFQNLNYIGQYHQTYLLLEDDSILYLIDQHAAMERCMYEKISKILNNPDNNCYDLLIPITLEYTKAEIESIFKAKEEINKLGIIFDDFGDNTIIVRTIPAWIPKDLQIEFLSDIFNHITNKYIVNKAIMYESLAKSLSCKKSIKAYMQISKEEVLELLKNLDLCEMPYTCPHGRPTLIKFTNYEIEKLFKRVNN
ncbi:MAG: DNA mismatch repair endonuclease MutL [Bacilli bacterium]|nr:DNA mismatch repair endonuclease MutL [Bacilli bacterium]